MLFGGGRMIVHLAFENGSKGRRFADELFWRKPELKGKDKPPRSGPICGMHHMITAPPDANRCVPSHEDYEARIASERIERADD